MKTSGNLATRIAEFLAQKTTHAALPHVARQTGGFEIPPEGEGSKRDRVLEALKGKSTRQLGEIAQRLGASHDDFELEEEGFAALEEGDAP